jgi:hypothetical protein
MAVSPENLNSREEVEGFSGFSGFANGSVALSLPMYIGRIEAGL